MSQENVEVLIRAIDHLNETGEPEWDLYDSELVWTTRADGPANITYRGLDGLRRGNDSLREVWAEIRAEVLEVVEIDDPTVAVLRGSFARKAVSNSTRWKPG